jgi:hypothetical protein
MEERDWDGKVTRFGETEWKVRIYNKEAVELASVV